MKMIKLPNGDWVNLATITSITIRQMDDGYFIVLIWSGDSSMRLPFKTQPSAEKFAEDIANQVNALSH